MPTSRRPPTSSGVARDPDQARRVLGHREELPALHEAVSESKTITRDRHWKASFLLGYGSRSERSLAPCPETRRTVRRIPRLMTAVFSHSGVG